MWKLTCLCEKVNFISVQKKALGTFYTKGDMPVVLLPPALSDSKAVWGGLEQSGGQSRC